MILAMSTDVDDNDNERKKEFRFCNENIPLFICFSPQIFIVMLIKQFWMFDRHVFHSRITHFSSVMAPLNNTPNEPCEQIFKQSIENIRKHMFCPFHRHLLIELIQFKGVRAENRLQIKTSALNLMIILTKIAAIEDD